MKKRKWLFRLSIGFFTACILVSLGIAFAATTPQGHTSEKSLVASGNGNALLVLGRGVGNENPGLSATPLMVLTQVLVI